MIKVEIKLSELETLGACPEGLERFKKVYGNKAEIIWDTESQLRLCVSDFKHDIIWAQNKNLLPKFLLTHVKLANANLTNADLTNADLTNANLFDADLSNAKLTNAHLYNANLYNANLVNANLYNANLSYANLYNANLSYANLRNADLTNADLNCIKYNKNTIFPLNFGIPSTAILVE